MTSPKFDKDGKAKGWVARADSQGRRYWVPWWEADALGEVGVDNRIAGRRYTVDDTMEATPVAKRTEQQQVESLTNRLLEFYMQYGMIPQDVLRDIQAEYWKMGATCSFEQLKEVAEKLLIKAKYENSLNPKNG